METKDSEIIKSFTAQTDLRDYRREGVAPAVVPVKAGFMSKCRTKNHGTMRVDYADIAVNRVFEYSVKVGHETQIVLFKKNTLIFFGCREGNVIVSSTRHMRRTADCSEKKEEQDSFRWLYN